MACHKLAVGIEVNQLVGHFLDILLHARGRFGPTGATQTLKARRMPFRPAIPLHMVESLQRNVQRVAAGKFQDQIIAVKALHREAFEALILGDAMLNMDDIVAHVEVFQRGEEGRGFTLGLRLVTRAFGKKFFFRQKGQAQVRCEESRGQIAVQDVKRRFGFTGSGPGPHCPLHRRHIVFAQERQQAIHLAATSCDEHHAAVLSEAIYDGQGLAEGHPPSSEACAGRGLSGKGQDRIPGCITCHERLERERGPAVRAIHEFRPGEKQSLR